MSEFKGLIVNECHGCHKRFSGFKGVNPIFCELKREEEYLDAWFRARMRVLFLNSCFSVCIGCTSFIMANVLRRTAHPSGSHDGDVMGM